MAYESSRPYERPQRSNAYQPPSQPADSYSRHAQSPYAGQDDYGQADYGQGYQQEPAGYFAPGRGGNHAPQDQYADGPPGGYSRQYQNQDQRRQPPQERSYDARYQQQGDRGPPPDHAQRVTPSRMQQPDPDPRYGGRQNATPQPQPSQYTQQSYGQQSDWDTQYQDRRNGPSQPTQGYEQDQYGQSGGDPRFQDRQTAPSRPAQAYQQHDYTQSNGDPRFSDGQGGASRRAPAPHQHHYGQSNGDSRYQDRPGGVPQTAQGYQQHQYGQSNGDPRHRDRQPGPQPVPRSQPPYEQSMNKDPRSQGRPQGGPPPPQSHQQHDRPADRLPRQQERANGTPQPAQRYQQPYEQQPESDPRDQVRQQVVPTATPTYQQSRDQSQYVQQTAELVAPPRAQSNGPTTPRQMAPPQRQQAPFAQPQDAAKMSMAEWKAREKAKMHANAQAPQTLPQDNAFPTFPNIKGHKPSSDRSGGTSAMSHRSSEERSHAHAVAGERPGTSRETGHHKERPSLDEHRAPPPRQAVEHEAPSRIPGVTTNGTPPPPPPPADAPYERPQYPRQPSNSRQNPVPANEVRIENKESWPFVDAQPMSQAQTHSRSPHQPHDSGIGQGYTVQPQDVSSSRPVDQQRHLPNAESPVNPRNPRPTPSMRPIDTQQAQQQQRPVYGSSQGPLSPAIIPPRPSTSQDARSLTSPAVSSPLSLYSHSQHPPSVRDDHVLLPQQAPKPWVDQPRTKHGSLGDIYENRAGAPLTPATSSVRNPQSREEEIEAEMPDFDSAAPGQKTNLSTRNQPPERQLRDTPNPSIPAPMSTPPIQYHNRPLPSRSASVQNEQRYESSVDQQGRPRPDANRMRPRQGSAADNDPPNPAGFSSQRYRDERLYQPSRQPDSYEQDPGPMQPPSAPFANPQPVRRSMDETRRMPSQGYGSQQDSDRMYPPSKPFANEPPARRSADEPRQMPFRPSPDGLPPRGQYPPQQQGARPNFNQPGRSDPGPQQRAPSAPPGIQSRPGPPNGPPSAGLPMAQQRPPRGPQQSLPNNGPDPLPRHPTPVRPGLMDQGTAPPSKPPPVRDYSSATTSAAASSAGKAHRQQASGEPVARPVTQEELNKLRAAVENAPMNYKQGLVYVQKLVEASSVLASEGGRADARTTAKNRERYIEDAYRRVKKLVSAGYPDAQFYLADCYGQGSLGLESDPKEAFNLYQAAAKAGHAQGAYRTAVCCEMGPEEGGGTRKDLAKAMQWYRRAAALGDPAAMYKVGAVLLKGLLGQPRNIGEAVTWLKRAVECADVDNPHALHELATLYESTNADYEVRNKVIADDNYARELFQQAAQLGYKFSQFRLGQGYEYGTLGLPIDHRASITWYTKAASQAEHQAELALSGWYLTGAAGILEHNDTEAYLWARKAAQSEPPLAKAMFAMGYFTETGIGCPASLDEAKRWYGRAAAYRFPKALERLEDIKKNGGKAGRGGPSKAKLTRKDQRRDEAECVVM